MSDKHHQLERDTTKKQPVLGKNAKPFAVQFVFVLFCVFIVVPFIGPYVRPVTDKAVNSALDLACSIGWCTPEAAARLNVTKPQ
ncbi:hypothetical protein [Brucella sp. 191011898]|uniref:hypothetical protein n=1 Tax=Brucella sp. 191011898 TaxID=2730447 RepID=UPI0015DF45C8|nr:hypothetical protein [Brucella sp. 191011898]CAB4324924.1 hypothetical protein BCH_00138 [Brucella sp. 191011898]